MDVKGIAKSVAGTECERETWKEVSRGGKPEKDYRQG